MIPKLVVLAIGLGATAYLRAMFLAGLRDPDRRRWPPKTTTLPSIVEIWLGAGTVFVSVYVLGAMDAGRLDLPGWLRLGVGLPLLVAGNVAVSVGLAQLGFLRSSGQDGPLKRDGLYRRSRHPQYLGHICALTGWVIYTGSLWSVPALAAAYYGIALAIRAEDAWLAHRHGAAHADYSRDVRRLI